MLEKFSRWYLMGKNKKLYKTLIRDLFSPSFLPDHELRNTNYLYDELADLVGVEECDAYDKALWFGNRVLLFHYPNETRASLKDQYQRYLHNVKEWHDYGCIHPDRIVVVDSIWRFLKWRYPKEFVESIGLNIFTLWEVSDNQRTERAISTFMRFDDAISFLKQVAKGKKEKIYWGRPPQDVAAMWHEKADHVPKSDLDLLERWRNVSEPTIENQFTYAYLESEATSFYKKLNTDLKWSDYYEIRLTTESPTKDSLTPDRLEDYAGVIVDDLLFDEQETALLEDLTDPVSVDALSFDALLLLVSRVEELERYV